MLSCDAADDGDSNRDRASEERPPVRPPILWELPRGEAPFRTFAQATEASRLDLGGAGMGMGWRGVRGEGVVEKRWVSGEEGQRGVRGGPGRDMVRREDGGEGCV